MRPSPIEQRVIAEAGLRSVWPAKLRARAQALAADPPRVGRREDLRALPLVTIDGANAKDFDDAVFAEPQGAGWRVIVAIADVSHYVQPGDPLDVEARLRGVSAYFPGFVLPMLPEILSNDLCSLKPAVDRLCLACELRLDAVGNLKSWRFFRGVMRSAARLTYAGVHSAIEAGNAKARRSLDGLLEPVENLYGAWRALAAARRRRQALDLELAETRVRLGPGGEVAGLVRGERHNAHRVIEELMIVANVAAARFLGRARMPALHRVHPPPDADGLEEMRQLFAASGHALSDAASRRPGEINSALRQLEGTPAYEMTALAMLRCLQQARYQPANAGHYGLALKAYTHFTSPIRRYPDLLTHRAIKHLLDGGRGESAPLRGAQLADLGVSCSELERQAEAAMRAAVQAYKLQFLSGCLGDQFEGVVSHGIGKGLFVQLPELGVSGMIPRWRLPARRSRSARRSPARASAGRAGARRSVARRSGVRPAADGGSGMQLYGFTLGQPVSVRIARVDKERGHLDLDLL
ncbi:ribonuclease R family protein [Candidatus Foliamicus sp.]